GGAAGRDGKHENGRHGCVLRGVSVGAHQFVQRIGWITLVADVRPCRAAARRNGEAEPEDEQPEERGADQSHLHRSSPFWLRERCPVRSRRKPVVRPVTVRVAFRRGGRDRGPRARVDTRGPFVGHSQEGGGDKEISAGGGVEEGGRASEPEGRGSPDGHGAFTRSTLCVITGRRKPFSSSSPIGSASTIPSTCVRSRSDTRICPSAATAHRRAAWLATLPMQA